MVIYVIKKIKTQKQEQNIYDQHLRLTHTNIFQNKILNPQLPSLNHKRILDMTTNFGIIMYNQFIYILLHLRNNTHKNPLNINIPDIAVFHEQKLYDILYNKGEHIVGFKNDGSKPKLKQLYQFFRKQTKIKQSPKIQPHYAVHKNKNTLENQYLMMSDVDLLIACRKNKTDPFFKNLYYIQNKTLPTQTPILVSYPPIFDLQPIQQQKLQLNITKLAIQSLMGFKRQTDVKQSLSEQLYLHFLNKKIVLYLSYEHNIRICKADFSYAKNSNGIYYFVNIFKLQFDNLTKSVLALEKKLRERQQRRNQILIMTPQKEIRYKNYQSKPNIKILEQIMTDRFKKSAQEVHMVLASQTNHEEIKNQIVFRKLHPQFALKYQDILHSSNFQHTKTMLFGSTRKPIIRPSVIIRKLEGYKKMQKTIA